jgi:hypothetical protein
VLGSAALRAGPRLVMFGPTLDVRMAHERTARTARRSPNFRGGDAGIANVSWIENVRSTHLVRTRRTVGLPALGAV